jgi:hypothetical protein
MEDQYRQAGETMRSLSGVGFPANLPVTFILSQQTVDGTPRAMPGLDWVKAHEAQIENNPNASITVLPGTHYIHRGNEATIAGLIRALPALSDSHLTK